MDACVAHALTLRGRFASGSDYFLRMKAKRFASTLRAHSIWLLNSSFIPLPALTGMPELRQMKASTSRMITMKPYEHPAYSDPVMGNEEPDRGCHEWNFQPGDSDQEPYPEYRGANTEEGPGGSA
ncbi:TPA: hypothetical protein ACQSRX_003016 [Pseudomonas aeruginosa]